MRSQCISRSRSTCSLPTTAMLFSDWQATTQPLQPVQTEVSIDHRPGVRLRVVVRRVHRLGVLCSSSRLCSSREVGILQVLGERRGADDAAVAADVARIRSTGAPACRRRRTAGVGQRDVRAGAAIERIGEAERREVDAHRVAGNVEGVEVGAVHAFRSAPAWRCCRRASGRSR